MKKGIALLQLIILSTSLFLSGCTGDKWYEPVDGMSSEWYESQEEMLDEALAFLEENPGDITYIEEVAHRYHMLGYLEHAAMYYEKCLSFDPVHIVCLNNIADVYESVEEYDLAADYIRTLFEQTPTQTEVLKDTVRILLEAGDSENATQALNYYEEQVITGDEESDNDYYEITINPLREDIASWEEENNMTN